MARNQLFVDATPHTRSPFRELVAVDRAVVIYAATDFYHPPPDPTAHTHVL
jgi:hypothetical protein